MEATYEVLENGFNLVMKYAILLVEIIGVGILLFAVGKALVGLFRKKAMVRLSLAEGIALALEFKMGGELLRTVVVREWSELLILGAVILLRAALTFLIHWEIKNEKKTEQVSTEGNAG